MFLFGGAWGFRALRVKSECCAFPAGEQSPGCKKELRVPFRFRCVCYKGVLRWTFQGLEFRANPSCLVPLCVSRQCCTMSPCRFRTVPSNM